MDAEWRRLARALWVALVLATVTAVPVRCQAPESVVYTVRAPAPETQTLEIEVSVPTDGRDVVELMMPVWSPGYYRVEDYAGKVRELRRGTARDVLWPWSGFRPTGGGCAPPASPG